MAIYVCDFETVEEQANNTCENAMDMNRNIESYMSGIQNNLSSWTGKAREAFDKSSETVVKKAQEEALVGKSLGEFMLIIKDAIYDLEQQLSNMNI